MNLTSKYSPYLVHLPVYIIVRRQAKCVDYFIVRTIIS